MGRGTSKREKTFELVAPGRPSRTIRESHLRAQLAGLSGDAKWREVLSLIPQLGEKGRSTPWICDYFLRAIEATNQHQQLLTEAEKAVEKFPRNPTMLSWNAHALRLNGRVEESVELLRRAIKQAKPEAALFNSLGSALKETGEFEEALNWFDRAITMQPSLAKAHWNRSDLVEDTQQAIASANKALDSSGKDNADRHLLHFSLYRLYEKTGDFDQAFHHLELGNDGKRSQIEYRASEATALTESIINFFDINFFDKDCEASTAVSPRTKKPLFIFGLPRSGTTLVEQILASHSQVAGGNELTFLNDASSSTQAMHRIAGNFPDWLSSLSETGYQQIGRKYLELIDTLGFTESNVTDKSLMNYRAAGLIAKALPNAKMIHVVRNPMDVAFGCYRQVFGSGHLFSYSYEEIAQMISDHQKLVTHWHTTLPGDRYLLLEYQTLVENPTAQISQLLEFCELEDEPACYSPEKTQRSVRTLSATQVRKPINRSGIGSWKGYESQLEPLIEILKKHSLI
ncbi:MAG: tetratricopeptide repeat protein [Porticoccaceae bacterium]|nr:tetratricopeptide repeat protein [Porticoccaceae bacterium]